MKYFNNETKGSWKRSKGENGETKFYPPAKHLILLRFFLCRK